MTVDGLKAYKNCKYNGDFYFYVGDDNKIYLDWEGQDWGPYEEREDVYESGVYLLSCGPDNNLSNEIDLVN